MLSVCKKGLNCSQSDIAASGFYFKIGLGGGSVTTPLSRGPVSALQSCPDLEGSVRTRFYPNLVAIRHCAPGSVRTSWLSATVARFYPNLVAIRHCALRYSYDSATTRLAVIYRLLINRSMDVGGWVVDSIYACYVVCSTISSRLTLHLGYCYAHHLLRRVQHQPITLDQALSNPRWSHPGSFPKN